jgi:hypothetical protein
MRADAPGCRETAAIDDSPGTPPLTVSASSIGDSMRAKIVSGNSARATAIAP